MLLAGFCLAALASDANWIEQYAQEAAAANKACGGKEPEQCKPHLTKLLELLDGRADIVYRLAVTEAQLGNKSAALDWLAIYSKSGLSFADLAADPVFSGLKESSDFKPILDRFQTAKKPVTHSQLFFTLPERDLISEDIAYDSAADRFFVSSVRHRKILAIQKGKVTEFAPEGAWAILALGVDQRHRVLWASTAAMPESIGYNTADEGRSALLKYSLNTGALVKRYDVREEGKHALGDLTVSPAGDVYVSDGYGSVFRVDQSRDALELLVGKGTYRSPQTPALSPDGRTLFVPDYSRGIGLLDLSMKVSKLLAHPRELSLGGIDGLYLAGKTLLAVQNGTTPPRIIRMTLNDALDRVTAWETLEANWDGFGAPTHGVVVDGKFYFIANSGWDRMADNGSVKPGAAFDNPTIRVARVP
jgi:hypothetical protein